MLRVTRLLNWLLTWIYEALWLGMIGGSIAFVSFRAGLLTFALAVGLVTCMLIAGVVVARSKDLARRQAARKDLSATAAALGKHSLASLNLLKQPYAEALPTWERATQEHPNDPETWARLALALNILGRSEEALAASEHALQLDAAHASAWTRKAAALTNLGRTEEALATCDHILVLDPDDASAWSIKALILLRLGRTQEASSAYDRVSPTAADATYTGLSVYGWYGMACGLYTLGRYAEALEAYDRVLAVHPTLVIGWLYTSVCFHKLGREADAQAAVRRAQALSG
jgi:protein O-GlcNAc transferase